MSFEYAITMSQFKRRAECGEDIFGSVQEVYLNSFLKGIAADAVKSDTHFITYYHAVVRWMLQQVRPIKEAICREYFINKSTVQYAGNFETLIVGDKQYRVPNGELN